MLGKLIKYDVKSTWRGFAGIYISILLGVVIVPFVFNNINNEIINIAIGFMAFGIVIAVVVVMIGNLFKIFNTNVFSKEGYLTMTLPVKSRQIIASKLIVSSMWIVLTGLVCVTGLFIFTLLISPTSFIEITDALQLLFTQLDGVSTLTIILLGIGIIMSSLKEVAKLFLACSIAHLKQLDRFRVPAGILSYFAFSWFETFIVQVFAVIWKLVSPNPDLLLLQIEQLSNPESMNQFLGIFNGFIGLGILYAIFLTALFSFGNIWILNNKLDLD